MSSSRCSRLALGLLTALAACHPPASARDQAAAICPIRTGDLVQAIDVFDGPPADMAYLAPDGRRDGASVFTLGPIYAEGRTVTIRCKYRSGVATDVEIAARVESCSARRESSGNVAVACR